MFPSHYNSSLCNELNTLKEQNLAIPQSHMIKVTQIQERYNIDFDDNDSGLGDSTPPSPSWSTSETFDEIEHRTDITNVDQDNERNVFEWELQDQHFDKGNNYLDYHKLNIQFKLL